MSEATAVYTSEEKKGRIVNLAVRINQLAELLQHADCCEEEGFRLVGGGDYAEAVGGAIIDATNEVIRLARNGDGPGDGSSLREKD